MYVLIPGRQDVLQMTRDKPTFVDSDRYPIDTMRERSVSQRAERELVREEVVARAAQEPKEFRDAVHVSNRESTYVVRWRVVALRELGHCALCLG